MLFGSMNSSNSISPIFGVLKYISIFGLLKYVLVIISDLDIIVVIISFLIIKAFNHIYNTHVRRVYVKQVCDRLQYGLTTKFKYSNL